MTNQEGAVLDDFVDRAIENLLQGLANRMTYPEAKRAVQESLMRGITRNLIPGAWAEVGERAWDPCPLSTPVTKTTVAQPMDESGFSAGFGVGND